MEENALLIVDIDSSREIRDHIEYQFASYKNSKEQNTDDLTILVGGAGFTGIELLGELAEKVPELCKKYDINRSKVKIINRSEEHTSELQSRGHLVCRLLLEKTNYLPET